MPLLFLSSSNFEASFNLPKTKNPITMCDWILMVGVAGFEPAASTSQTWRDNRATLHPELVIL